MRHPSWPAPPWPARRAEIRPSLKGGNPKRDPIKEAWAGEPTDQAARGRAFGVLQRSPEAETARSLRFTVEVPAKRPEGPSGCKSGRRPPPMHNTADEQDEACQQVCHGIWAQFCFRMRRQRSPQRGTFGIAVSLYSSQVKLRFNASGRVQLGTVRAPRIPWRTLERFLAVPRPSPASSKTFGKSERQTSAVIAPRRRWQPLAELRSAIRGKPRPIERRPTSAPKSFGLCWRSYLAGRSVP
jgi:hypothetical protein